MAYLMSDVAVGSQAALQLQQNMAAAPNVQQVEANKMQEQQNTLQRQQVQIQQEQANAAKTNLANLVADSNIKATEKSKATLQDLYKTPEFQDAVNKQDNPAILKMTQVALFKAGDIEKASQLTSEVDKANAAQLANQEKQNNLDAVQVSRAYYNLKEGATLESLPEEQKNVLIKEVGKANWDKFTPEQRVDVTKNLMMITSKRLTNQLEVIQDDKIEKSGQFKKDINDADNKTKIIIKNIGEEGLDRRESSKESAAFVREKLKEEGKDTRAEKRLTEKTWSDVNKEINQVGNARITLNLKNKLDEAKAARQKGPTGSMDQIKLDNNYRDAVKDYNNYELEILQKQLRIAVSAPDSFKDKKYVVDKIKQNIALFDGGTNAEETEVKKAKPTPDKTSKEEPKKATSNKLTSEQQSWVDRAKAANPGMSEADIIAEGKKKGKL